MSGIMLLIAVILYWDLPSSVTSGFLSTASTPPVKVKDAAATAGSTDPPLTEEAKLVSAPGDGDRLITVEELANYDGKKRKDIIWLAVLGEVFDVTKGARFYGEGEGYSHFAGQDGSAAFVTGAFEGKANDLMDNLTSMQISEVEHWRGFYHTDYTYVGKLLGTYYDEQGQPTAARLAVKGALLEAEQVKKDKELFKQTYPRCNSKWSQLDGGKVWCSNKSGGVTREWPGLPRYYYEDPAEKKKSCVCVQEGLLDSLDEHFVVIPGCEADSDTCKTAK